MKQNSAFTLLELISVIVIASLIGVATLNMSDNSLLLARDQLIGHIRYTQTLALFDNKYRNRPKIDGTMSAEEISQAKKRVKEWYKSFWQLHLGTTKGNIYYTIFSDSPTKPNSGGESYYRLEQNSDELAIDPDTKSYLSGTWKELSGANNHPLKSETNTKLNLTIEYRIEHVSFVYLSDTTKITKDKINIFFDNLGRPYILKSKDNVFGENFTLSSAESSTKHYPFHYLLQERVQIKLSKDSDEVCFNIEPITGYISIPNGCSF